MKMNTNYYSHQEKINILGIYTKHHFGYFHFLTENGEEIIFEEIARNILNKYDLKSDKYLGKKFSINYSVVTDNLNDEDFVILRIDKLNIL